MNRQVLKAQAKDVLKNHYWPMVGLGVLLMIFSGGSGSVNTIRGVFSDNNNIALVTYSTIVGILIMIFVVNPLTVGVNRYMIRISRGEQANFEDVIYAFRHGYFNVVKIMFIEIIFILLWSLLLVIPGIYKAIEYSMIPFLLAEDSTLTSKEAFAATKQLMSGHIGDYFVLTLSFILLYFAGAITFGILYIFYVVPYVNLTYTQFYLLLTKVPEDNTFVNINNQNTDLS